MSSASSSSSSTTHSVRIGNGGQSTYSGNPAILLAAVVALLVNAMFTVAMLHCQFDPRVTLSYVSSLLLYTALYLWRRLHVQRYRHAVLRRGLGYAAVGLAAFLSVLFLYSFAAPGIPLPVAVAAWLLLAVPAAYCLYRVIVLHLDAEEEEGLRVRVVMQSPRGASSSLSLTTVNSHSHSHDAQNG